MHPEIYIPADAYAALVNDLVRVLTFDHELPCERRASIAAALHRADLFSPALMVALAEAEPCIYSGEFTADDVRWTLGEHDVWPVWMIEDIPEAA
ncbi:MAG: hypothetical protein IBJ07_20700 [Rhizobiaceae bacterium]|nr:hypothetical protein [Rhizobiaceae bacterium]